jgi:hypothetical protein
MAQNRSDLFYLDVGHVFYLQSREVGECVEGGMEMKRGWQELGVVDTIYEEEDHDECFRLVHHVVMGGRRLATASGRVGRVNLISQVLVVDW